MEDIRINGVFGITTSDPGFLFGPLPQRLEMLASRKSEKVRVKRRKYTLIVVIPKLMTPLLLRLFNKEMDMSCLPSQTIPCVKKDFHLQDQIMLKSS